LDQKEESFVSLLMIFFCLNYMFWMIEGNMFQPMIIMGGNMKETI